MREPVPIAVDEELPDPRRNLARLLFRSLIPITSGLPNRDGFRTGCRSWSAPFPRGLAGTTVTRDEDLGAQSRLP